MKCTAVAPSNIAFIKYWGKKDETLRLPINGSISMNLTGMTTTTTVDFSTDFPEDTVEINDEREYHSYDRIVRHVDRIRKRAGIKVKARIVSHTNFPRSTGLSSSASGFAALTVAGCHAAGLSLSEKELSILARQGSGSACRSIPDGFVEWRDGNTSESSYAASLYPSTYWDLVDIVAVVNTGKKKVPTTEGMKLTGTSPFFAQRQLGMKAKLALCKSFLATKDFTGLGELAESEALEMHAVMITSKPSLLYWTPGTLELMKSVFQWRKEGLETYFTINTGQDVHILCESNSKHALLSRMKACGFIRQIIENHPSSGAKII
jgi:diphosphomevalonate decarboxylase